jgi:hypothetical protein
MADDKRDDDKRRSAEEERKYAADAESKRIAQAEEDRKRRDDDAKKAKAEQRDLVPNAEGNVQVEAIMGPYRGQRLTMPAAEGQAAIDEHWARDPTDALYEHEALDDEHRQEAYEAAHTWAQAQWDAAQGVEPPDPPPPEGGDGGITRRRAMQAEEDPGYKTRQAPEPPKRR